MSTNDKKEMFKFAIKINLFMGIYNLFLFTFSGMYFNLVIGAMNLGVFIFFRDVKIVEALNQYISKKRTNYN
tara:strand:- start:576 stop:791 length:216 start_codon:yes stop_codon:yes gene_type:complete